MNELAAKLPPRELEAIPVLGSGIGYRDPWFKALTGEEGQAADFLEITADHFFDAPAWKLRELDALTERFTLIPHALDLSLGTAEGLDECYLAKLASLVARLSPPYWSEHLAFTKAGGRELGHLAPLPFSEEAVETVARNVKLARHYIDLPLALENVTYGFEMPGGEMDEATFLTMVLEVSECGWLLDVTNLYVNSVNHKRDPFSFLCATPMERVVQLHYVGFSIGKNGFLIDDHGADVDPQTRTLMEEVLRRCPAKGAILERDQNLPPFAKVAEEMAKTREAGRKCGRWA
ncbi:MAG: DUF692 domain-containing protein [Opitutae bacterium]|jgi:uncharacterized protein|nr:DUF692 domain-containing protein [Opitutae bacterium]MBT5690949.1 DUF692 domain-containing protein [Opitutae bacterium]MBT6461094.1 DUF692 domain-containing protein [Opitutae bacterium]MBT7852615.1 DUF692 domain-containing protein [Opitutae bacterium]